MGLLKKEVFVCIDCETTGLDPKNDSIIEVALCSFTTEEIIDEFETLINPKRSIPEESLKIHHISETMLIGKPPIEKILPQVLKLIGRKTIIGHGVGFDIDLIVNAAERMGLPCSLRARTFVDTLRLARHYGNSQSNSLENLAIHFNVPIDQAHRAMSDVKSNIEVFKHLTASFKTTEELFKLLAHPIKMRLMPLGKHKGRPFSEIPLQYLQWAAQANFDQDLLFSIRSELKKRKKGSGFSTSTNPFSEL